MNFETFLQELDSLSDEREFICKKIKSHGLPVIVFGAKEMARQVKTRLSDFGIEVEGFAVDAEYFRPNKIFEGLPVFNFDEVRTQSYVFVLGMNSDWLDTNRSWEFMHDEQIIRYSILNDEYDCINKDFISEHRNELREVFNLLEDDFSRQTLFAQIKALITGDPSALWQVFRRGVYFNELTSNFSGGFVDCGAYRGDTVERFINWRGGRYEKIFALEPDEENFSELKTFVHDKGYKNVVLFNCGVWHEKTVLRFERLSSAYSKVADSGEYRISVENLDNLVGNEKIGFIKLTAEGSELNGLKGATKIIETQKPVLAVSIYQTAQNILSIPQTIKSIHSDYKIYLRKHSRFSAGEWILYAVP